MFLLGGVGKVTVLASLCAASLVAGCSHSGRSVAATAGPGGAVSEAGSKEARPTSKMAEPEIEDLRSIPQELAPLADAVAEKLAIPEPCRLKLVQDFERRFFAPWTESASTFDSAEVVRFTKKEGRTAWYGVNKRRVSAEEMQELIDNCALERFPTRDDPAISVAPAHLRGLPTNLPFYEGANAQPFDMLSFPQVKLNEPLRILHTSRDGVWLFVRAGYSSGWIERRNVALVDKNVMASWTALPRLVVVRDYAPISDGTGVGVFRAKIGTILPLAFEGEGEWRVLVASAGVGEHAHLQIVPMARAAAEPFPLPFNAGNIARLGDQMLGQPYGWGEIYDLRDCSALLRDLFLPFGIWLPRTSRDQIASVPRRIALSGLPLPEKEETIRKHGVPFLTLLYKPGHIMLYVGEDTKGRPLVFHDAWSIRIREEAGAGADCPVQSAEEGSDRGADGIERLERCPEPAAAGTRVIGEAVITTLQPGEELGLVPGSSLLERITELGIITGSCGK